MKKLVILFALFAALVLTGCRLLPTTPGVGVLLTPAYPTPILITGTAPAVASPSATVVLDDTATVPAATATVPAVPTATATAPATSIAASPTAISVLPTDVQYIMAQTDVNIRSGPGAAYTVVGWVAEGQTARVTGASRDRQWWRVVCPSGASSDCWVTAGAAYTQPSAGPVGQPTASACSNAATFVADVTIPDGTKFAPGAFFVKTWRLRNSGSCTWGQGSFLAFKSGDRLGPPADSVALSSAVAPGATVDISVDLKAPTTPGSYAGYWELVDAQGRRFGVGRNNSPVSVKIVVEQPNSPASGVSGAAWRDANGNGRRDSGESLVGVPILLMGGPSCSPLLGTAYSNNAGEFGFSSLNPGDYCLVGADQTAYVVEVRIRLEAGQKLTGVDVIYPQPTALASISGMVFQDLNGSQVYDAGEPGVPGRTIALNRDTCQGLPSQGTAISDSGGIFRFDNILPGRYCVALVNPGGIEVQMDVMVGPGQSYSVAFLRAAMSGANGSIGGSIWSDYCRLLGEGGSNGTDGNCVASGPLGYRANGLWDFAETTVPGVTVRLLAGACTGNNNTALQQQTTDSNGRYLFRTAAGTYCVFIDAPAGDNVAQLLPGDWTYPAPGVGYQTVTIGAGEERTHVNFGWDYQLD